MLASTGAGPNNTRDGHAFGGRAVPTTTPGWRLSGSAACAAAPVNPPNPPGDLMDRASAITRFTQARLDEAEAGAESIHDLECGEILYDGTCTCGQPSRVRADAKAKRRTLEALAEADGKAELAARERRTLDVAMYVHTMSVLRNVAKADAEVWSDHEDYADLFPDSTP